MSYKITDNCVGCTLCAKNCPVDAISGALKELHVINELRCVECGVCGNVCPKSAITDAQGNTKSKVAKTEWLKPDVATEKCTACGICVYECKYDCLTISYPKHKGDTKLFAELTNEKKCVGCEMCAKACPLDVITMIGGN